MNKTTHITLIIITIAIMVVVSVSAVTDYRKDTAEACQCPLPVSCDAKPCVDKLNECMEYGGDWISQDRDGSSTCFVNSRAIDIAHSEREGMR